MIIVEAVNNASASYSRLCNYVMLNSNEPIKVNNNNKYNYNNEFISAYSFYMKLALLRKLFIQKRNTIP